MPYEKRTVTHIHTTVTGGRQLSDFNTIRIIIVGYIRKTKPDQIFTKLNKHTMNNNSRRQHDRLDNCSSYSEHVDSIFPTPILFNSKFVTVMK